MADMLALSADLPDVDVPAGHVLCAEGERREGMWVLVSGSLAVTRDGVRINTIDHPGAIIGEVQVLLHHGASASVVAETPCRLKEAADGAALLRSNPEIAMHVARGLAERLTFLTTYLADLRHQYGDPPGLAMVPAVLRSLSSHAGPPARPGSARDPEPEY